MLPLEPANTHKHVTHAPKTLTCTILRCVTYSRYQQFELTHTQPQSTLTCTIHKHVTYSQYNTHTHMAVALQSASEVPQLKGSKQRVQTNSNCFSFFLFVFLVHPTTDNCTSSSTTRFVEVHLTGKVHTLS